VETVPEKSKAYEKLLWRENKDYRQWGIHLLSAFMVSSAFTVNLLRGSKKNKSIVGLEKCSAIDWTIFVVFLVMSSCFAIC
jgi:hypothetical protein